MRWWSNYPSCRRLRVSLANLIAAYSVSDPSHIRYGQHLTADEVNELITPSKDTLLLMEGWLYRHGITAKKIDYSPACDWITLRLPISIAEDLLQSIQSSSTKEASHSPFERQSGHYPNTCMPISNTSNLRALPLRAHSRWTYHARWTPMWRTPMINQKLRT